MRIEPASRTWPLMVAATLLSSSGDAVRPASLLGQVPVNQLRDPAIFQENGETHLLYSVAGDPGFAVSRLAWEGQEEAAPTQAPTPLDVARTFAERYPENPSMSYVPALSWVATLRLAELTGEERWREKVRLELEPFLSGEEPAVGERPRLTGLAGHAALFELARLGEGRAGPLVREAARLMASDGGAGDPGDPRGPADAPAGVAYATGWTDDLYMATSFLARVAAAEDGRQLEELLARFLTSYVERLQRPDGLFVHAEDGPVAWGRGNGFAALGMTEALLRLPADWSGRAEILDAYRRQMEAFRSRQTDDGSWRQVVDEPESRRELTVTAMAVTAMARGVRRGWHDAERYEPVIRQGWEGVLARTGADGTVRDACDSTGAGPTLQYYLDRPFVSGSDDRAGGLVLLAAVEMEELRRWEERAR